MGSAHAASLDKCSTGDAPSPYDSINYSCPGYCEVNGSTFKCDLRDQCTAGGGMMWITRHYGGSTSWDLSIFGECYGDEQTRFCCVFDEGESEIDTVVLAGTEYNDEPLGFTWNTGYTDEVNLEPWDSDPITGYILGHDGGDLIRGSNYSSGTLYIEYLYGMAGADVILGYAGWDALYGGIGDDGLDGGGGNDRLIGGDGTDELHGGTGADHLCDTTGSTTSTCVNPGEQLLMGDANNDTIWYVETAACPGAYMSPSSDAAGGTDACGDSNAWDQVELPDNCENPTLTAEPAQCIDPN